MILFPYMLRAACFSRMLHPFAWKRLDWLDAWPIYLAIAYPDTWLATAYTMSMNATRRVDHEFDSFVDWAPILNSLASCARVHGGVVCLSPSRDLRVSVGADREITD